VERQHPTPPRQEEKLIKDVTEARAKLDDKRKGMTDFDAARHFEQCTRVHRVLRVALQLVLVLVLVLVLWLPVASKAALKKLYCHAAGSGCLRKKITMVNSVASPSARSVPVAVRFVVMSIQHSGTHFVQQMLAQAPRVAVFDEVFLNRHCECHLLGTHEEKIDMIYGLKPWRSPTKRATCNSALLHERFDQMRGVLNWTDNDRRGLNQSIPSDCGAIATKGGNRPQRYTDPDAFMSFVATRRAVGFLWQRTGNYPGWNESLTPLAGYLKRRDVRVVFLERANPIAHSLASSNALLVGRLPKRPNKQYLNLSDALEGGRARRRDCEIALRVLHDARIPTLHVTYETLNQDHASFLEVFAFLGINDTSFHKGVDSIRFTPKEPGVAAFQETKHHPLPPIERVENPEAVWRAALDINLEMCLLIDNCEYSPPQRI